MGNRGPPDPICASRIFEYPPADQRHHRSSVEFAVPRRHRPARGRTAGSSDAGCRRLAHGCRSTASDSNSGRSPPATAETMCDVGLGFAQAQRLKVKIHRHALSELPAARDAPSSHESPADRPAGLQRYVLFGVDVRQQPQLLQHPRSTGSALHRGSAACAGPCHTRRSETRSRPRTARFRRSLRAGTTPSADSAHGMIDWNRSCVLLIRPTVTLIAEHADQMPDQRWFCRILYRPSADKTMPGTRARIPASSAPRHAVARHIETPDRDSSRTAWCLAGNAARTCCAIHP